MITAVDGHARSALEADARARCSASSPAQTMHAATVVRDGRAARDPRETRRTAARRAALAGRFRRVLQPVAVGTSRWRTTRTSWVVRSMEEIRALAEPLQGRRVVHVSATAFGGGVSEILYTLVPLMKDVGLEAEWQVIYGREEFFNATKLMHNALQGAPEDLSDEQWETWRRYNEMNARELVGGWDVALIHDPQPAALRTLVPEKAAAWVWRCHIDLSTPNRGHDRAAAAPHRRLPARRSSTCAAYVPGRHARRRRTIVPPAIDPLAPKNMALSPEDASYVCQQFGIDVDRPLI